MTNGDKLRILFPEAKVTFHVNLNGVQTVDVDFEDPVLHGIYSVHTFSREWWDKCDDNE